MVAVGILAAACGRSTGRVDAGAPPRGADETLEAAACAARSGCRIESALRAGSFENGKERVIVCVDLPEHESPPCTPRETWLMSRSSREANRVQLLVAGCTPSSWTPPTVSVVSPGRVRYERRALVRSPLDPPEHYVAPRVYDIDLARLEVVRSASLRSTGPVTWSLGDFTATSCGGDYLVAGECIDPTPMLPHLRMGEDPFVRDGWRTTALDGCALRLGGAVDAGAGGGATEVHALLANGSLYVEVEDDAFVTSGAVVDRLTLEVMPPDATPLDVVVWGLAMDGAVTRRLGRDAPKPARRADLTVVGPSKRRLRLANAWPSRGGYARIVYEDTSDGRTVRTRLVFGSPNGEIQPMGAACATNDGALRLVTHPRTHAPDEPLAQE